MVLTYGKRVENGRSALWFALWSVNAIEGLYVWEMEQQQRNFRLYTKSIYREEHTLLARLFLSVKSGRSGTHLAPEHRVNFSPLADRRLSGSQAHWLTGSYICRLCCCGHTGWM